MQNEVTPVDHQREHLRKAMHALATANDESIAPRWQVDHLREAVTELIEFARLSLPSVRTAYDACIPKADVGMYAQDRTVSEGELSMALSNIIVRVNDPESADIKTLLVTLNEMDPEMYVSTVRKMILEKAKEGTKIAVKTPDTPPAKPLLKPGEKLEIHIKPLGACHSCEAMLFKKLDVFYDTNGRGPFCGRCYHDLPPEFKHEEEEEDNPLRNTSGGPQI